MSNILMRTIGVAMLLAGRGHASVASSAQATEPPVVSTAYGRVSGVRQGDSHAYLGLPFAKPPVGDLRWRAPAKADSWTGVRDGSKFPANCYQAEARRFGPYTPEFMIDNSPVSEDCLYLNVWVQGTEAVPCRYSSGFMVAVLAADRDQYRSTTARDWRRRGLSW